MRQIQTKNYIVYYRVNYIAFKSPSVPDPGIFWRIIQDYQVRVLFTAPTAIRAIKKEDPKGLKHQRYDTSCLRNVFLAGERCDVSS